MRGYRSSSDSNCNRESRKNLRAGFRRDQAEVAALQADNTKSADDVAVVIFEPLFKRRVSKTVVAEQLAALIDASSDTAAEFAAKLPTYIVDAIEHVTAFDQAEPRAEDSSAAAAGVAQ